MENPKKLYGHQEWPPLTSVNEENVNEMNWDNMEARNEVKNKLEEGR